MKNRAHEGAPLRVASLDALRGVIMILMALDHVRDFVHWGAMSDVPTNLASTTPLLFATRWITHICAPAFALCAGISAWLWMHNGKGRAELSRFLVSRGLWLALLELTVMRYLYNFGLSSDYPVFLLVLWSLGWGMVILAALVWLPRLAIMTFTIAAILLHPLLGNLIPDVSPTTSAVQVILLQAGALPTGNATLIAPYPLVPWAAIMALGFAIGPLFAVEDRKRRTVLLWGAAAMLGAFLFLRAFNLYGDPAAWTWQENSTFTVMSFLNTSKYPPSPQFSLMTLGSAFLLLAVLEGRSHSRRPAISIISIFGRVPLFFYLLHFLVAHLLAILLAFLTYGSEAAAFAFVPFPSFGGPRGPFPPGFGYDLETVYAVWLAVLVICYPACRWFASFKARRGSWWLRYL